MESSGNNILTVSGNEKTTVIDTSRNNDPEILWLASQTGERFVVNRNIFIPSSVTINNLVEDAGYENEIPLPNVKSEILNLIIEYAKYHHENPVLSTEQESKPIEGQPTIKENTTTDLCGWDIDFVAKMGQENLFLVVLAANYLDMKDLLTMSCKSIANMIKGKTPEEIRATFGIENDFTPEEEEQVRKENEWLEEE